MGHTARYSDSDDDNYEKDENRDISSSSIKSPPQDNHISNNLFDHYRQKGIDKIQAKCTFNIQRLLALRDKHISQMKNSKRNGKMKLEVLMQSDLFDEGLPLYDTERNPLKLKVLFVM